MPFRMAYVHAKSIQCTLRNKKKFSHQCTIYMNGMWPLLSSTAFLLLVGGQVWKTNMEDKVQLKKIRLMSNMRRFMHKQLKFS